LIWQIAAIFILASCLGFGLRSGMTRVVFPLFVFVIGVATSYLATSMAPALPWVGFLAPIFAGITAGYIIAWTWNTGIARNALVVRTRLALVRLLSDFRVSAVLIGLLISYVITFYFAGMAFKENPPGFWLAFYAAWVSGLLFFTIVGLIAGLVTLYRPERDVFAARVKILTGGKSGSAVDYIANELKRIGYVAKITERTFIIEDYDQELDAYYALVEHVTVIRNIYDDVTTAATGKIAIELDELPRDPGPYGRMISFKINGTNQGGVPFDFGQSGFIRPWEIEIPAGGEGRIEYEHGCWYKASEIHHFTPNRFTEQLQVKFRCRCRPTGKRLLVKLTTGGQTEDHLLDYDGEYALPAPLRDLNPGEAAYRFNLAIGP
jgi:hypothetical protein